MFSICLDQTRRALSYVVNKLYVHPGACPGIQKKGGRNLKQSQFTFSERRAFMLALTSAGLILLKPPNDSNDFGFLAIERVKLDSKTW